MKVLVVDDEPNICWVLYASLKQINCEVLVAFNYQDALAEIRRSSLPDRVIADLNMHQNKMDGWKLLRVLRTNPKTAKIPFIIWTACSGDYRGPGWNEEIDTYIVKPDIQQVLDEVQKTLSP